MFTPNVYATVNTVLSSHNSVRIRRTKKTAVAHTRWCVLLTAALPVDPALDRMNGCPFLLKLQSKRCARGGEIAKMPGNRRIFSFPARQVTVKIALF
ncbi:MAG: hypothetical protein AB7T07_13185 [Steroidobacteraceae bacterium]